MKRSLSLLLVLSLLCALLAGCSGKAACPPASDGGDQEPLPKTEGAVARCRVVAVSEGNTLLLADVDSERGDIYTLDAGELLARSAIRRSLASCSTTVSLRSARWSRSPSAAIFWRAIPHCSAGWSASPSCRTGFDDRCALYLRVLNDLWGKDEGLNSSGVEYISVDLAATSLTPAERSAVAWTFAQSHGAEPMELSYEQLCAEGYISGLEGEDIFPAWENGVLFTITETDDPVTFNLPSLSEGGELPSMMQYNIKNTVSFDASKWRTALGAYGFSKCVAVQNNDGVWGDYHINGPEWIS